MSSTSTITADSTVVGMAGSCLPCKSINGGPYTGEYILEESDSSLCSDGCLYSVGNLLYCFGPGDYEIFTCDAATGGTTTGVSDTTTEETTTTMTTTADATT